MPLWGRRACRIRASSGPRPWEHRTHTRGSRSLSSAARWGRRVFRNVSPPCSRACRRRRALGEGLAMARFTQYLWGSEQMHGNSYRRTTATKPTESTHAPDFHLLEGGCDLGYDRVHT
jgi:hypothetical protein